MLFLSFLLPNSPFFPYPNASTSPSSFIATTWFVPMFAKITFSIFLFSCGVFTSSISLFSIPNSLLSFIPQAYNFPSVVTITVVLSPALISFIPVNMFSLFFLTATGVVSLGTLFPFDSCPYVLSPIAYAFPSFVSITVWFVPSSKSTIFPTIGNCSFVEMLYTFPSPVNTYFDVISTAFSGKSSNCALDEYPFPQAYTFPFDVIAKLTFSPASTFTMSCNCFLYISFTTTGDSWLYPLPIPSCPFSPYPHAYTFPVWPNANT